MSCVYFLENFDTGLIKIGKSTNLNQRKQAISRNIGAEIICVGAIPGGHLLENTLHKDLQVFRKEGEWFEPHKLVIQTITDLIAEYGVSGDEAVERFSPYKQPSSTEDEKSFVVYASDLVNEYVDVCASKGVGKPEAMSQCCIDTGAPHSLIWALKYRPPSQIGAAAFLRILSTSHDINDPIAIAANTVLNHVLDQAAEIAALAHKIRAQKMRGKAGE